jgi:hypothetical protein
MSDGFVLSWSTTTAHGGLDIATGCAIALWICNPILNRGEGPAGRAAPQMDRRWKPVRGDPPIECRATQGRYAENIAQPEERRHDMRGRSASRALMPKLRLSKMSRLSAHATRLPRKLQTFLLGQGRFARFFEHGPLTCRCLPIQSSMSARSHPTGRP